MIKYVDRKLNYTYKTFLKENFSTSIIIPCNVDVSHLRDIADIHINYWQRNGIEIVLIFTEETWNDEFLKFVKSFPFINWKIFTSEEKCLGALICSGISESTKDFVMLWPINSFSHGDVINELRYPCEFYKDAYTFCDIVIEPEKKIIGNSMLFFKDDFHGCSTLQALENWNEIFTFITKTLDLRNLQKLYVYNVSVEYKDCRESYGNLDYKVSEIDMLSKKPYHRKAIKSQYDWEDNIYSYELCKTYLKKFPKHVISESMFARAYPILAMIQTRNEIVHIEEVLKNLEGYVDGILLLDDGSDDGTYENAVSEKLLVKVKKRFNTFNDLQNRNILLDLASFFKCEWLIFLDADERINHSFGNPRQYVDSSEKIDTIGFNLINLCEDGRGYIANIRDTNLISDNGILFRWRMFRNIGRSQITTEKKLHFRCTPYLRNAFTSDILINHHLPIDKGAKNLKLDFYKKNDEVFTRNFAKGIYDNIYQDPVILGLTEIKLPNIMRVI